LRKPAAAFRVRMELPEGWEFRERHWNPRSRACALTNTGTGLTLASCRRSRDLRTARLRRLGAGAPVSQLCSYDGPRTWLGLLRLCHKSSAWASFPLQEALSGVWPAFVPESGLRFWRNAAKASLASADRTLAANSLSSRPTA